jgi:hypothetical protein
VISINVTFTRYLNKHPCPIWSASDSLRIRYTSIRICNRSNPDSYLYPRLFVFEFKFHRRCENKYSIGDICHYGIRLHRWGAGLTWFYLIDGTVWRKADICPWTRIACVEEFDGEIHVGQVWYAVKIEKNRFTRS